MAFKEFGQFKVVEFTDEADQEMLKVSEHKLDEAFAQQPGGIAHFGRLRAQAMRQAADFKFRRDLVTSVARSKIRDQAVADSKKMTETALEDAANHDKAVQAVNLAYNYAKEVEETATAAYFAFTAKKDTNEYFARKKAAELGARGSFSGAKAA